MKKENRTKLSYAIHMLFWIYMILLLYFVLISERTNYSSYRYNLEIFREIRRLIDNKNYFSVWDWVANLIGNVFGFVPFGFLLPWVNKEKTNIFFIFMYTLTLSVAIEITQLIFKLGVFDVDDLILNTLGGIIGYILFCILRSLCRRKRKHVK